MELVVAHALREFEIRPWAFQPCRAVADLALHPPKAHCPTLDADAAALRIQRRSR